MAYQRTDNLLKIFRACEKNGIANIYLAIDGPRDNESNTQLKIKSLVSQFYEESGISIKTLYRNENLGCAVSILSACDWVFSFECWVAIIEDDCLPSDQFFEYVNKSREFISNQRDIWLTCGTQFVPTEILNDECYVSKYPLIWGWATTDIKWYEIRNAFLNPQNISLFSDNQIKEIFFWNSGARRALAGITDVWDTVLVQQMISKNKFALLPSCNLVTNVGNDEYAQHTKKDSIWLNRESYASQNMHIVFNSNLRADEWLREYFYEIKLDNIFRYFVSLIRDFFIFAPKHRTSLKSKLSRSLFRFYAN